MSKRLAILATTTALVAIACPATAQDNSEAVADTALRAGHSWADEPQAGVSWDADAPEGAAYEWESREVVQDTFEDDGYDVEAESHDGANWDGPPPGYRTARRTMHRRGPHHAERSQGPRLAYTAAERDEWLAQCRSLHARQEQVVYYEEEEDADGGLIGGIIGAVTGGFAGNRIADGDRLLGTIVGAGLGGLAGAVIGSIVDGGDDDDDRVAYIADDESFDYGFDYCAAYLQNYERGYGTPAQVAYAPVMMVPVAQGPHQAERRISYRVIEEEVDVDAHEPRPARRHIRRAMPAREQGKLTPNN